MHARHTMTGFLITGLTTGIASADIWTVDDDGPADFTTIQDAVNAASDGDEIHVHPGTYSREDGDFMPVVDFRDKNLTLLGIEGREATIIDARDFASAIQMNPPLNFDIPSKIDGFTIRNGQGGGIVTSGPRVLKVGFCTIEDCREPAIWSYGRVELTVSNCTIRNNDSTYLSGGIVTDEGDVLIINSTFSGNYSDTLGGALRLWGSYNRPNRADIIGCTFEGNIASQGAAVSANRLMLRIDGCTFAANTGGQGTVLYMMEGVAEFQDTLCCAHDVDDIFGEWVDLGGNEFRPECEGGDCVADLDGNGSVDGGDLTTLLGSWGTCGGCAGDLTGDGTVDGADLTLLLGLWGDC
ncbi:MAG: right-handed parallel beta-helix repeat-containing protein [Phycisphaerales bacterium]|nr:right-handed parallel beta-helix repeat-containing protein [Phycisphaerales bacterium]